MAFVRKQAKEEGADDSDTNCSSIAFMLECGEHRIAMLGDAFADIIEETIDNKYKDQAKPMECDAMEVMEIAVKLCLTASIHIYISYPEERGKSIPHGERLEE